MEMLCPKGSQLYWPLSISRIPRNPEGGHKAAVKKKRRQKVTNENVSQIELFLVYNKARPNDQGGAGDRICQVPSKMWSPLVLVTLKKKNVPRKKRVLPFGAFYSLSHVVGSSSRRFRYWKTNEQMNIR